jgi:DNA-3-methyladenine glycosylase I
VGPAGRRGPAALFEKLSLEALQAGLSWLTILRKRERFREVFSGFDPAAVARLGVQELERLLADPGIVRNRAKIEATVNNARRYAELAEEFGSLAGYVWQYEPDPQSRPPLLNHATLLQLGQSPESVAMSKYLRRRGWSFVGPTTVYAFMQAMGLVNDRLEGCDRRPPLERERQRFRRPQSPPASGATTRTSVGHHAVEQMRPGRAGRPRTGDRATESVPCCRDAGEGLVGCASCAACARV